MRPIPVQTNHPAGGLGKEFLKAFAISGARSLAVIDRDLPVAEEACREIRESVVKELEVPEDEVAEVNAWGCDVTDTEQVRETIGLIGKKFGGGIDIFVGAAGDFLLNSLSLRLFHKLGVNCFKSLFSFCYWFLLNGIDNRDL